MLLAATDDPTSEATRNARDRMPDTEPTPPVAPSPPPSRGAPASPEATPRARRPQWLRRPLRMRIRSSIGLRLGVLALALGLPFVVYVGGNAAHQASLERDEAKERTLSLARLTATRIDDYVGDVISALALVDHGATVDAAGAVANDAFLQRIRADLPPAVDAVGIWTLDGRNVGALDRGQRGDVAGIADRGYFRAAVDTRKLAIDGPLRTGSNGDHVVVFARPVLASDDHVAGVVTVSARLRDLEWLLDLRGAAPSGTVVSIVNARGDVLARNLDPQRWIGRSVLGVGNARAHLASREGVDETRGSDGVERIAGYTQAGRVPWHVFVGMPAEAALSTSRANLERTLLLGALSLLVGAMLFARLGVRIAQPLRELAYDALLLARGDLAHRTKVRGDDETGVLASTLNRMAQMIEDRTRALQEKTSVLEDRTAALERTTMELATITANVPVVIAYVDAEERFRFVNEYFRDVSGASPDRIVGRSLRDVFGDEVYARFDGRIRDVLQGLPQTFETSFAPGARKPVFLVTCFPDYGDGQAVLGAYVVCQDITRRTEAEEALEARERFIRLIADAVPARITYSDRSERLLFGNRRFAEYWGSGLEGITGRRVADVVSPGAYAQIAPELARSYAGEARRFDLVVDRAEGTQYFQVDHVPDVDPRGNVQGVVTISQDVTALRQAKQALIASERRMRMVADNLPALIAYLSADERYLFVNARSLQMFGLAPEQLVGRTVADLLTPDAYAQTAPHIADARAGRRARFQRTVTRNGREYRELVELIPDQNARGDVVGFYGLVQDVTDLHDAQAKAEASEQRLRRITDNIPSMVAYIDRERRYRFNSRYYETWLERPLAEITGRHLHDVLGAAAYAAVRPNLDRAFAGERVDFDVEVPSASGARFVRGTYVPDFDAEGQVVGVYSSSSDVTPLKEVERQLERLAQNDTLTGLPNRHMFNDGISAALRRSQRTGTQVALLFLDVDGFKRINDTLGHAAGDDVLREFARRLTASVRSTDLVARLAGDEFVIVLEGIHTREECRFVARKIIAAMRSEFRAGDSMIRVTTSIGIALGHGASTTAEALLKRADTALYAAKGRGRDRFEMAI
jgi:diguanylate cyclase (GGDEF)-like protein/PAS domain S-box-containing protein